MEVRINLETDSDNSIPAMAVVSNDIQYVKIELFDPDRTIRLNAEDLKKILDILF